MSSNVIDPKEATFLIVDDDGQVRDILAQYLNSFGFNKVIQAKDGKAAIKIIQNHSQRIDFIISDWEMPHIDGLTLLRAVRKDPARASIKFLMVSSQSSHERMKISKAAKSRVDAYLVKPFRANILKDKINILMNGEIDESAAEFEAALNREVPSNNYILAKVAKTSAKINPKTGTVRINSELPPEKYDLKQMNIQLIINLAKSYTKVKWFDKAVKLSSDAIVYFPDNADLHFYVGQAYFFKQEFDQAIKFLKTAVKLQPYHVGAHSLLNEINNLQKTG
ncbi:MAG: response regulator [Oligoflexia bacterium]|nr:response regulator [Oligoflexia bacterium]